MELDVEIGVLDPVRLVQTERHLHQAAAKRRDQRQPGLGELGQPLKGQRTTFAWRIQDAHAAYMPVDRGRVECQECGVQAGELLHHTLRYKLRSNINRVCTTLEPAFVIWSESAQAAPLVALDLPGC